MSGGLMQLIAVGSQNAYIPRNESYVIESIPINFGENIIPRSADTIKFKHIAFNVRGEMSIDEFKRATTDYAIELIIGGSDIIKLDFKLLLELNPITKINNTFCIKLPHNYLVNEILLIAMQHHDTNFRLTRRVAPNAPPFTVELFVEHIFYDYEARQQLTQNAREKIIQQIHLCGEGTTNENMLNLRLNANHPTKGFFIQGDINEITRIKFMINGNDRFDYGIAMIGLYCQKISNNLLWLSLTGENNYENMSAESYVGSLNLSRIDVADMQFVFSGTEQKTIRIYNVCMNVLRYMSGMAGIVYGQTIGVIPPTVTSTNPQQATISFTTEFREIEPDKMTCPITLENIGIHYCKCTTCNNNFDFDTINHWLGAQRKTACPLCRTRWTNFVKYERTVDGEGEQTAVQEPLIETID